MRHLRIITIKCKYISRAIENIKIYVKLQKKKNYPLEFLYFSILKILNL